MKTYSAPTITEDSLLLESIYAASGTDVPGEDPGEDPGDKFIHRITWASHNSGSHSDVSLDIDRYGLDMKHSMAIEIETTFEHEPITDVSVPFGATPIVDPPNSTRGFTLKAEGNENTNINPNAPGNHFSFQIIDKNSMYGGSYYESNTHINEDAKPQFIVKRIWCY